MRGSGRKYIFGAEQILDSKRNAFKLPGLPLRATRIRLGGSLDGLLRCFGNIGVQRLRGHHRRDMGGGQLACGKIASIEAVPSGGNPQHRQITHYSITFGTAKKPSSRLGALATTSST